MKLEEATSETRSFPKDEKEWNEAWRRLMEEIKGFEEIEVVEII